LRANIAEVVENFDLSKFGSAPTKFDAQDLIPLTARHLATLGTGDVADVLTSAGVPDALAEDFWKVVRDNINTLDEVADWWALMRDGATPLVDDEDRAFVADAFAMLPPLPYTTETWGTWTTAVKEATGRKGKTLFMPLRKAVTGRARGPEMADVMPLLQKAPTLD
jgi:glutamyl-tRNA synthetase